MSNQSELAQLASVFSGSALSNRNMVINGGMTVAQRSSSATGVSASTYVACDRFYTVINSLGTYTVSQASDSPSGFASSLKYECTTADASPAAADYFVFQYRMEGQDVQRIAKGTSEANPITLSFWVKSNVTGTYSMYLRDIDNNRGVGANYAISSSGVWEYKTVTIPADTTGVLDNNNDLSLSLEWWLGSGTDYSSGTMPTTWGTENTADRNAGSTVNVGDTIGNYFQITGVQLEIGDTSTAFEHELYSVTLQKCQRYFQRYEPLQLKGTMATGSNFGRNGAILPVEMRSTPTITLTSIGTSGHNQLYDGLSTYTFTGTIGGNYSNSKIVELDGTVTTSTTGGRPAIWYNNSDYKTRFDLSAEL